MASAMRKMAVYLGLVEDDHRYDDAVRLHEEYDEYDEQATTWTQPTGAEAVSLTPASGRRRHRRRSRQPADADPDRPTWPGSRHCTRARTMRHVRSGSTSARALR